MIIKKLLLFLGALFSLLTLLHAQSYHTSPFMNSGFEYWQGNKHPIFWLHPSMIVTPDSLIKFAGKYSLKAVRLATEVEKDKSPYGLVFQNIGVAYEHSALHNKKVDVSIQIKCESVDTSMYVSAFIQVIDQENPSNNKIVFGNNAIGKEWIKSSTSIVLGELPVTSGVYVGVLMSGCGEIRMDDYRIQIDGKELHELTPRTSSLTVDEKNWLQQNIIPIAKGWAIDKKRFGENFKNAHIVGIGDNVHGSSSVVQLKNLAAKALIENEGFTILAIEDSPGVGASLDRFVRGKEDVLRQYEINIMYSNNDFKSFMTWLRAYNRTHGNKIKVFGVDINSRYQDMIEEIKKTTSNKYTLQLDSIHNILNKVLAHFSSKRNSIKKAPFSASQVQYITENLETIKKEVVGMAIDEERKELTIYYIDNLLHYLIFDRREREKQMAHNINWLRERHPDEKIIYLAHNGHVRNPRGKTKSTGSWLKEWYQNQYAIIGTCYYEGTDLFKQRSVKASGSQAINVSVKGSYEYLFNQIPENCFYLDLKSLNNSKNTSAQWLTRPMLMRDYGVEPFTYTYEFTISDLVYEYDGVLFIKESVPL